MRARKLVAAVWGLLMCASAGVWAAEAAAPAAAPAPGGAAAAPEMRTIKVQAKLYRDVSADSVYQAALMGIQADVRFQDTFDARVGVPSGMGRITIGPTDYLIVLAFHTRTDLICLVPASNPAEIAGLLGLPGNVPLTPAALSLPMALNAGQQITIEGTVLGTVRGQRYVLADSVNTGMPNRTPADREVHLFWPSQPEPRIITQPGQQTYEFPCTHAKGKTDTVTVTVQAMTPDQLNARLAALQGQLETGTDANKVYGQYSPRTVYGYAGGTRSINVDFTDQVLRVLDPAPRELVRATSLRLGLAAQLPIVRAFVMAGGPTILIPDTWPTVLQESAKMIPGEIVRVHGTTMGVRGMYNCVLVDYLTFPEQGETEQDSAPWWVSIQWKGIEQPYAFWDYGQYPLTLPCQNVPGKFETLTVLDSRFREYKVPVPPNAAGPNPAPPAAPAPPAPAAPATVPKVGTGTP